MFSAEKFEDTSVVHEPQRLRSGSVNIFSGELCTVVEEFCRLNDRSAFRELSGLCPKTGYVRQLCGETLADIKLEKAIVGDATSWNAWRGVEGV
jgi:hypothetical protein